MRQILFNLSLLTLSSGFALDRNDLIKLLGTSENPLKTCDEVVEKLPEEHQKNYIRVYDSRAEFKSDCSDKEKSPVSPKFPRIITFGTNANLVISYRGNPAHAESFNNLQFIEFTEKPIPKWDFYEVKFPVEYNKEGKPKIAHNSNSCLGCHGNPPRPLLDAYFLWPGMIGSEHDHVDNYGPLNKKKISKEQEASDEFFERQSKPKRYGKLSRDEMKSIDALALGAGPQDLKNLPQYSIGKKERLSTYTTMAYQQLAKVLAYQIASELNQTPYRYALVGTIGCFIEGTYPHYNLLHATSDFFPSADKDEKKKLDEEYEKVWKNSVEANKKSVQANIERHKKTLKCWFDSDKLTDPRVIEMDNANFIQWEDLKDGSYSGPRSGLEPIARLRYLLEKVGVKDLKLTFDKEESDYLNSASNAFWYTLERELALRLFTEKEDKNLRDKYLNAKPGLYSTQFNDEKDQVAVRKALCLDLQKKSVETLKAAPPPAESKKEKPVRYDFRQMQTH